MKLADAETIKGRQYVLNYNSIAQGLKLQIAYVRFYEPDTPEFDQLGLPRLKYYGYQVIITQTKNKQKTKTKNKNKKQKQKTNKKNKKTKKTK